MTSDDVSLLNNAMNLRPASFSGSAWSLEENAAQASLRGRPQVIARPLSRHDVAFRSCLHWRKAEKEKRGGRVKALQRLLVHSFSAKLCAVRRVVVNKGKRTPGVDGVFWKTPEERLHAARSLTGNGYSPLPLRRI